MTDTAAVIAVDSPKDGGFERLYVLFQDGKTRRIAADDVPELGAGAELVLYPTRTYSEGLGGGPADVAPEDRAMIRALRRRCPSLVCRHATLKASRGEARRGALVSFDPGLLAHSKQIFESCMTKPNRQDYMYLVTKTFGLNLAVRLAFTVKAVRDGQLPIVRAVASTSWYQLQDAVFTVFGQTYMKFLGKMTGLLKVAEVAVGDFFFVYFQLCGFEFLNRLVLGPLGENPLAYTWHGIGLIFLNIMQGMISGGPLIPAVNKLRKVGLISHSTMMHLYQLSSLTMQFGLFASFGYQKIYALLTGSVLVLSWSSYVLASTFFKDPDFSPLDEARRGELSRALQELGVSLAA